MLTSLYLSLDQPGLMVDIIKQYTNKYKHKVTDKGLIIYPSDNEENAVTCTINIKTENQSSDAFTNGLYSFYEKAPFKNEALREKILSQIYYTNVIADFEAVGYNNDTAKVLQGINSICEEFGGFVYNKEYLDANAFQGKDYLSLYSGMLYDNENLKDADRNELPFFKISDAGFKKDGKFADVYEKQKQFEEILAKTPVAEQLEKYFFYDQQYDKIVRIAEAIPENERDWKTTATLGLAYYAQSYFIPNGYKEREKAKETILSVRSEGEGQPYWHYALAYVLFISDPEESAKHYQIVLNTEGQEVENESELKDLIESRKDQAERDKKYKKRREKIKPNKNKPFEGFNFDNFWEDTEYELENYVFPSPDNATIEKVEKQLGYKLPQSYKWLMKQHNGGSPYKIFHKTNEPTTWSEEGAELTGIYAIGDKGNYSLCGGLGSRFMIEKWEYPDIGVYICFCPTGHDMIALDYRYCGADGEPQVVHVAQEDYFKITYIADDFESFIRGLEMPPEE